MLTAGQQEEARGKPPVILAIEVLRKNVLAGLQAGIASCLFSWRRSTTLQITRWEIIPCEVTQGSVAFIYFFFFKLRLGTGIIVASCLCIR